MILDKNGGMINADASYQSHGKPDKFEKWLKSGKDQYKLRGDIPVVYAAVDTSQLVIRDFSTDGGEELKSDIELR